MKTKRVPIDSVQSDPANARRHGPVNMEAIKGSLARFGQQKPIVVDKSGVVRAGNGTLEAAKALGWAEINVVESELEGVEMAAFAIADNRTAELAEWDGGVLAATLQSMNDAGEQVDDLGFTATEMQDLFRAEGVGDGTGGAGASGEIVEDDAPEPQAEVFSQRGDLWLMGNHRVLCGDSTKAEDVDVCLRPGGASCVFTDPPYGMSYKGSCFGKEGIANDGDDEFESVLTGAASLLPTGTNAAICFSPSRLDRFFSCVATLSFLRILTIYKPNRNGYPWRSWVMTSEIIALFGGGEWPTPRQFCHDVYTYKYEDRPGPEVDHPNVKSLAVVADVVSKIGTGTVYDPFLGSGTTVIACEQLNRKCYGIEIDPRYVDVIVRRWEKFTGKKATLQRDGDTIEVAMPAAQDEHAPAPIPEASPAPPIPPTTKAEGDGS